MTGEAVPVPKRPGDTALSGTINLWGVLEGRVLRPASESSLQKIIRLIQNAQNLKAPSQRFTDEFGTGYTWTILSLCTAMFFIWWLGLGLPPFDGADGKASAFSPNHDPAGSRLTLRPGPLRSLRRSSRRLRAGPGAASSTAGVPPLKRSQT